MAHIDDEHQSFYNFLTPQEYITYVELGENDYAMMQVENSDSHERTIELYEYQDTIDNMQRNYQAIAT